MNTFKQHFKLCRSYGQMRTMNKVKRTGLVANRNARAFTEHKSLARQILSYKRKLKIAKIWQIIIAENFFVQNLERVWRPVSDSAALSIQVLSIQ